MRPMPGMITFSTSGSSVYGLYFSLVINYTAVNECMPGHLQKISKPNQY